MADVLPDLRERFEYAQNAWQEIRKEAATDMRFVSGDPWDANDKKQRTDRPTVAPEELSQYRNQVINVLMSNPRGAKFAPVGNGANDKGAAFYQNKWREIEYRSHATQAYLLAADNALQRSYGFVRVKTAYAHPRSANQELWVEGFPDPDMVLPDPDAKRPDSGDQQFCFVLQWSEQSEFKKTRPTAKITNFGEWQASHPDWIQGKKVLEAEYWTISTRRRTLLLVQLPPAIEPARSIAPSPQASQPPVQVFEDELKHLPPGRKVLRELRAVDYPTVKMYLTNGLEILEEHAWLGKYIPIVSCYGKVIYVPEGGETKRKILSMTRFGRDPWKSYCYACSQELEVLAMIPKAPLGMYEGQMDAAQLNVLKESMHTPKAAITFKGITPATGANLLPPPQRIDYAAGQHLQALEVVKEGFRRAIQAAMGSNFLPTQAQRRNEKSGVVLDKIDQAAAMGTYHFVYAYDGLIRQCGVVGEDLMDKIYDYRGETATLEADLTAIQVRINDPDHPEALSTKGDYIATVTTAPSSDSEREAAADFLDTLVGQIERIAQIAGPQVATKLLARAIRMRNMGALGDQLADLLDPPQLGQDGKPLSPQVTQLVGENQQLKQLLQRAAQEKDAKVVELQGKFQIASMQEQAATDRAAADREVKLAVAEIVSKSKELTLFLEESKLVGARVEGLLQRVHDSVEAAKDRTHERLAANVAHEQTLEAATQAHDHALEEGDQGVAGQLAVQAAAPQPDNGAGA